jgi:MFS family permease
MVVLLTDSLTFLAASVLLQAVTACGGSAVSPAAYPLAVGLVPAARRATAVALLESCYGVGLMLGPPLGGLLFALAGFMAPFWASGLLLFLVGCLVICLFKDPGPTSPAEATKKPLPVPWRRLLGSPATRLSLACLACTSATWCLAPPPLLPRYWYSATLQPFLAATYGLTEAQTGLVFMVRMALRCAHAQ